MGTRTVKAKLILISEDGRKNSISSGYRPNHIFEYNMFGKIKNTHDGEIVFHHKEQLPIGEENEVYIRFKDSTELEKKLKLGTKWHIHEGNIKVGEAVVTGFVDSYLQYASGDSIDNINFEDISKALHWLKHEADDEHSSFWVSVCEDAENVIEVNKDRTVSIITNGEERKIRVNDFTELDDLFKSLLKCNFKLLEDI